MAKPFALVKFPQEDDSLAVIPVEWLAADRDSCSWPVARSSEVTRLAKEKADPAAGGEWISCPVVVVTTCRSYKSAEKKARRYENTSAFESSAVSGNEGHDEPARLPSPPPLTSEKNVTLTHSGQQGGSEVGGAAGTVDATLLKLTHLVLEVRQQQRDVLQRMQRIEEGMLLLSDRQPGTTSALRASPPPAPPPTLPTLPLPAYTQNDIEAVEAAILDDGVAAGLRKQLVRLGGKGLKEVASRVLTAVMGVAVQRLYSLHGRKGKFSFLSLKLCKVATDAICEKTGVDVAEAQGFIGKWLPGSVDRGGGRKRRFAEAFLPSAAGPATLTSPCASAHSTVPSLPHAAPTSHAVLPTSQSPSACAALTAPQGTTHAAPAAWQGPPTCAPPPTT